VTNCILRRQGTACSSLVRLPLSSLFHMIPISQRRADTPSAIGNFQHETRVKSDIVAVAAFVYHAAHLPNEQKLEIRASETALRKLKTLATSCAFAQFRIVLAELSCILRWYSHSRKRLRLVVFWIAASSLYSLLRCHI
jgi:hypothetical protein